MPQTEYERAKQALLALDRTLDLIEASRMKGINLFDAVDMTTQEIKHSGFLAWLLSPARPHGLGNAFLRRVLEILFTRPKPAGESCSPNSEILCKAGISDLAALEPFFESEITVEKEYVVHNRESRIDIFVESKAAKTVLVIENKVFTGAHDDQLERYRRELADRTDWKKIFVFLTPHGDAPSTDDDPSRVWCVLSYADILRAVRDLAQTCGRRNLKLKYLLEDYIDMVDTNILKKNRDLRALCKRIRREHADAVALLLAYTDNSEAVLEYAAQALDAMLGPISIVTRGSARVDFYTKGAAGLFGDLTRGRAGYPMLYRISATNGAIVALAFLEKAQDETWSEPQRTAAALCLGQPPVSDRYCTLFTVPLLSEEERSEELDMNKDKIDAGLRTFAEKVTALEAQLAQA